MIFSDKFIKASDKACSFKEFVPAPYLRKSFFYKEEFEKAEITICGLGFYELYINGKEITKGYLAPYISNPEHVLYYDCYDVTDYLNKGENVIGIILGNGFRNPYGAISWGMDKAAHIGPVTVALCLEIDGNVILEADESFKTHPSPILYDDMRMGYCYDARLEIPDWCSVDFDDSSWKNAISEISPKGIKRLCEADSIIIEKEITAVDIKYYDILPFDHKIWTEDKEPFEDTYRENVYVYDFGINTAGLTKLRINGKPGQKIVIRHGEETINGLFSENTTVFQRGEEITNLYHQYGQVDTFICKGGYEEFVPKFKYDGFRYAYVEGLEPYQATSDAVTYLVMHSNIKRRSGFSCSDDVLNKIYACAINSDFSNFFYFPTDCPHREKHGWTGDGWLSAEQMLINLTVEKSLQEWLVNIRLAQREDGALPGIIPTDGWGFEWGNGAFFDSICVQLPYYLYKYTGNTDVVKDNSDMIIKYLKYAEKKRDETGLVAYGLGDWADPFENENGKISAPLELVSSVAIYDMSRKAAFLFECIGYKNESDYAIKLSESMKKSIREHLIDYDTLTVKGDCQTSQVLSISMGIFNANEMVDAKKRLIEIIHRDGDINTCGVYGERFLYDVLSEMGEYDLAYKMITATSRTGYGHWIKNGATSLWERWNDAVYSKSDNSKNHHFHGHVSSLFIQHFAGIKPNPNATDITFYEISPCFVSELENCEAYYDSQFGRVSVSWRRCGEHIVLSVEAPIGTHGVIKTIGGTLIGEWSIDTGCNLKITI